MKIPISELQKQYLMMEQALIESKRQAENNIKNCKILEKELLEIRKLLFAENVNYHPTS